jgi:tetratricopeptide (TPR) repeat protein
VIKRGVASAQLHGMASEGARQAFERAHALCDHLPETPAVGWALSGLGQVRFGEGNYTAAHALATRIHALGLRHDEPGLQVAACNLLGTSCASLGDHRAARRWLEQGIEICEDRGARLPRERFFIDPGVTVQGHLAVALLALHLVDQARRRALAALARGRTVGHPMAEAFSHRCAGMLELRLGQPERVAAHAASLAQLAGQHGILPADAAARLLGGWVQAHLGDPATGHARIQEGLAILRQLGLTAGDTQVLCYAAEAAIAGRDWAVARGHVDEALALAQRLGERARVPDLLLLQGRIALGEGQRDAARSAMHTSLAEARAQEALGFELAALVGLCELDEAQPEELDALRDACTRIEEGLDTALVGRAHALLAGGKRPASPAS